MRDKDRSVGSRCRGSTPTTCDALVEETPGDFTAKPWEWNHAPYSHQDFSHHIFLRAAVGNPSVITDDSVQRSTGMGGVDRKKHWEGRRFMDELPPSLEKLPFNRFPG